MKDILTILIDTNVLMHINEYNMNLEDSISELISRKFEIAVHPMVVDEVITKLKSKGKEKRQAKFALQLMKMLKTLEDENTYTGTDTALLTFAKEQVCVVLTFDKILKERCRKEGIATLSLGKWDRMQLEGYVS